MISLRKTNSIESHSCSRYNSNHRPVEARNVAAQTQLSSRLQGVLEEGNIFDAKLCKSAMRYSQRVYSDLGLSSNLVDLMAATEENEFVRDVDGREDSSKSGEQVSCITRFGSGRYFRKGGNINLYRPCGSDKDTFGQIIL
ncbi:hypothetical protein Lalb_Chr03g0024141 [Lupinus albus]|uniref:Uncharacterized protein n=1 Tax=Lupinus albus TaxID=3870 RepID=A0A6A4QT02_LUPAL|nr:hypothetical protein Lalb_Chr03g0024141 [Lupinus albus]